MDNPLSGATTELFADELLPPRLTHHFWVLRFAGEGLSYYPGLGSPSLLVQFNFTIGYHRGLYNMYAFLSCCGGILSL